MARLAMLLILFASMPWCALAQPATAAGSLAIRPERVEINLFYTGASVEVRAEVPVGYEAAIRLMARPQRLVMKKLGRKAGVLWMGIGDVAFEGVPALYQVLTSAPLAELGPPALLAEWRLGYQALVPDQAPGSALRPELVGLKEHEGLFALGEGKLEGGGPGVGIRGPLLAKAGTPPPAAASYRTKLVTGTFHLPARAPAGEYMVDLIGFKDQAAVHLGSVALHVEHVGMARAWRHLAIDHGLAHGIIACVVAIVIGLLTGLLFRPKSEESH